MNFLPGWGCVTSFSWSCPTLTPDSNLVVGVPELLPSIQWSNMTQTSPEWSPRASLPTPTTKQPVLFADVFLSFLDAFNQWHSCPRAWNQPCNSSTPRTVSWAAETPSRLCCRQAPFPTALTAARIKGYGAPATVGHLRLAEIESSWAARSHILHHVCSVALWLVWAARGWDVFRDSRVTPPWERNALLSALQRTMNKREAASRIPVRSGLRL